MPSSTRLRPATSSPLRQFLAALARKGRDPRSRDWAKALLKGDRRQEGGQRG